MPDAAPSIGILTVSDRAYQGVYDDRGGPAVEQYLRDALTSPWAAVRRMVPDEQDVIETALCELCDDEGCCFIVTTGGTGPAPRDVTPEATMAVCDRLLPGFGEEMRRVSMTKVPTAILSRQVAGLRGTVLILNLPGNPKAVAECLDAVFTAIPHAIRLAGGPSLDARSAPADPHAR